MIPIRRELQCLEGYVVVGNLSAVLEKNGQTGMISAGEAIRPWWCIGCGKSGNYKHQG